ncbi:MAG: hypothetical protein GWN14_05180 [candidate division Zixibacteria bacterium]|nr:hypothetical protein [candidate division Zixibacteria bacterium]
MKESNLSRPVQLWLEEHGWTVYTEVIYWHRAIDIVAERGEEICVVELKLSFTKGLRQQLSRCHTFSNAIYGAVASSPNEESFKWCKRHGVGVLQILHGCAVELLQPSGKYYRTDGTIVGIVPSLRSLSRMKKILARMTPGGVAGKPNEKGVGPAQDVERAIVTYRESHPKVTWLELWEQIPNHYVSPRSMCSAMRMLSKRRLLSGECDHE